MRNHLPYFRPDLYSSSRKTLRFSPPCGQQYRKVSVVRYSLRNRKMVNLWKSGLEVLLSDTLEKSVVNSSVVSVMLANNEIGTNLVGFSPILSSQLTSEEIHRCENNPESRLQLKVIPELENDDGKRQHRYTPKAKRNDKPNAILWLIKYYPEMKNKSYSSQMK